MAKPIHSMVRVLEEQRSVDFYLTAFGMEVAERFAFEGFTLVYLRSPESEFELELTINHDQKEPYQLGNGYGHIAFSVSDLEAEHQRVSSAGLNPMPIKEMVYQGRKLAKFFFLQDPDGYRIEVLQRQGRYI
ncbi:MAG: VOC family protein [Acetobacteraceae bacterium]|nr:VOC family protein [Acetobacteraceae bacterium]MBV8521815.1 VOC family protein [Acetobacteraceae bacterium]MBV8592562.1 VOC family protein [Acetobacteraceae bacterium]